MVLLLAAAPGAVIQVEVAPDSPELPVFFVVSSES